MFDKNGPKFIDLMRQAMSSTETGYDMLAPRFDATPFRTPNEVLQISAEQIGEAECALDLCCGTGAAMLALLPRVRRRLVGIDFSAGMLAEARKQLDSANIANGPTVDLIRANVLQMNFNGEFDLAVCFGALGHILPQDEAEFARLIAAALRPGGRFVFVTGNSPPIYSIKAAVFRVFNVIMRVRNKLHKPEFIMYYLTFMLPEIEVKLRAAGFTVEVRRDCFDKSYRGLCLVVATKV